MENKLFVSKSEQTKINVNVNVDLGEGWVGRQFPRNVN